MNLAFWKRNKAPAVDGEATEALTRAAEKEAIAETESPAAVGINTKKRLLLAMIGGVVLLLLAAGGLLAWKLLATPPESADKPAPPAKAAGKAEPDTHAEQQQIEALKKRNEELAAQVEALKKEKPPEPAPSPPAETTGDGGGRSAPAPGPAEVVLTGKDPKTAAQALKKAIEEMNAAEGTPQKPRK